MPDPLKELLEAGAIPQTTFPPASRYAGLAVEEWDPGDGGPKVPYLERRFCPRPDRFSLLYEVRVVEGDRRDNLANRHAGDPELWWRMADANGTLDPRDLQRPAGRRLVATLPEGVPGATDE